MWRSPPNFSVCCCLSTLPMSLLGVDACHEPDDHTRGGTDATRKRGPMMRVFCARSMHVAVTALARPFAQDSAAAPDIVFEPMGALQARLAAGETADVLILAAPAIDALA